MIQKFRKKPVEIEAVLLTIHNSEDVKQWCGGRTWSRPPMRAVTGITISTRDGDMNASYGDWIIKDLYTTDDRKFYPCKPDIFDNTYEPVND